MINAIAVHKTVTIVSLQFANIPLSNHRPHLSGSTIVRTQTAAFPFDMVSGWNSQQAHNIYMLSEKCIHPGFAKNFCLL